MNQPARNDVAVSEPRGVVTPMQMLQLAVEKGAQLDVMERLMGLQERWEANEARKAFVKAMTDFKVAPPTLIKNKHVSYPTSKGPNTEYDHATLDQVCNVIAPALSEHGLSHRWEIEQMEGGQVRVTCVLTHAHGHSERVWMQSGRDESGGKNNIQAVASTVTYLERYTLLAATGLAARDQDDDAKKNTLRIDAEQKAELIRMQQETGTDTAKFLKYLGVASLDDLAAVDFSNARDALLRKKEKAA